MNEDINSNDKWKKLESSISCDTTKDYKIVEIVMPIIKKLLIPEEYELGLK